MVQGEKTLKNLINIESVKKNYLSGTCTCCDMRSTKALENTDFNIKEHECFSLIGENGAGKSTIYKIIIGEEK